MFKCMFIKRKLYDYLQGCLREKERSRVKEHLDACNLCRRRFNQTAKLIEAAADKTMPFLSQRFWHDFRVELDEKLNRRLVSPFKLEPLAAWSLKPALVLALILMFILGGSLYKHHGKSYFYSDADSQLVDEATLLDEVDPESGLNSDEDVYLHYLDQLSASGTNPA